MKLSTKEIAERAGCSIQQLWHWSRNGDLVPAYPSGGKGKPSFYDEYQIETAIALKNQPKGKKKVLPHDHTGELFNQMPKQTANNPNGNNQFRSNSRREEIDHVVSPVEIEDAPTPVKPKPKLEVAAEMGFNKNQVAQFQKLANNPDVSGIDSDETDNPNIAPIVPTDETSPVTLDTPAPAELIIDDEFKSLIPPLSEDEFNQLEENILRDGIQDSLKTWQGILIDGHNRFSIAQKHGLHFKTTEMHFADRDAVTIWIIENQFGRRNITKYTRGELSLKLKAIIAARAKANQAEYHGNQYESVPLANLPKVQTPINTRDELAKIAGVSSRTMQKVMTLAEIATPEIKSALRSGEISIDKAFNDVKRAEKESQLQQAQTAVDAQIVDEAEKPILFVGDGIGFVPDEPYKLLLTDPPYSTDVDDVDAFAESWLPNALQHVRRDGFAYVFIGAYPDELKAYLNVTTPENISLCQVLVWTYRNTLGNNPRDHYKQNWQACLFYRGVDAPDLDCPLTSEQWAVQDINAPDGRLGNRYHTWQKPDEIAERFIRHTTRPGDTVFDPFACTGTFLIAAAKLGRKGYGFELDADNAKIAFERGCRHAKKNTPVTAERILNNE